MSNGFLDRQGFVDTRSIERSWNSSIGSEATRNEFKSFMADFGFSREDSATLFDTFNVNGDDALSTAEFLDGLAGTDTNRSSKISREEFEASTGVTIPDAEDSCEPPPRCGCDDDEPSPRRRDDDRPSDRSRSPSGLFDNRGALNMDRAERMFSREAGDEATQNEFNRVLSEMGLDVSDPAAAFAKFDVNGDGAVSRSEFLDSLLVADGNRSGSVIREELESFLDS